MNKRRKLIWVLLGVMVVVLGFSSIASGMVGGNKTLNWLTVFGGSHTATGGEYVLSSTNGQVSVGEMTGGDYRLASGFWAAAE